MTEAPLMNHEFPCNFPQNMCISTQTWEILENIKQNYDRKIERAADENDLLRREVRRLESEKSKLEAEKEDLFNDVQDLRALLKRIHEEGESQLGKLVKSNKELKEQVATFKSALETSHSCSKHFDEMSFYWQEFLPSI